MKKGIILFYTILLAVSCSRKAPEDEIIPRSAPPLSRSIIGYGVVNSSYAHILDKRGGDGKTAGILRKGAIVEVLERRPLVTDGRVESWILASNTGYTGWLRENELNIYDSKVQAETASRESVVKFSD
jgi:hypothetical protein